MIEPILVTVSLTALGTWGIRVLRQLDSLHGKADDHGERLARVEGRLGNGLATELRKMTEVDRDVRSIREWFQGFVDNDFTPFRKNVEDHIKNEELRILEFCEARRREQEEDKGERR